jgi:cation:H+ antiporter
VLWLRPYFTVCGKSGQQKISSILSQTHQIPGDCHTPNHSALLRAVQSMINSIESTGAWAPWIFVAIFLAASLLAVWRLESVSAGGLEGTVLGTLVTPYMTGIGNLIFAFVLGRQRGEASQVMTNCLTNNVTNMTLVLGLPAIFWGMNLFKKGDSAKKSARAKAAANVREVNRLSLLLTLLAVLFFTGLTWMLGADGTINFTDGVVLVGVFLFWQSFHVFEVLKTNVRRNKHFKWFLAVDLALLAISAYAVYVSTDWLVTWLSSRSGFISARNVGLLSGWLNVLPNAMLAFYYAWTRRPEVVYTSQVGDGHICIPLCIGVFALFKTIDVPAFFTMGVIILVGATLAHFLCIAALGRLPRWMGVLLTAAYGWFVYTVINPGLWK